MDLSESLIFYRAKHRLTQKELAKLCGVCVQTIYSIENKKQKPQKMTEGKILDFIKEGKNEFNGENCSDNERGSKAAER